jgi:hypothetical protein
MNCRLMQVRATLVFISCVGRLLLVKGIPMKNLKLYRLVLPFVLTAQFICFAPSTLWSQTTFRGGISGTVQDQSAAAVPNATVTATDEDTGIAHPTVSSSAGVYTFADLPLGHYTVSVQATGFQPMKVTGIPVTAGQVYDLPVNLTVAQSTTTVSVSAASVALDTSTTMLTATLPSTLVQNMPLDGRDFKRMVAAVPGFAGYSGVLGSVNGTRANQTNWQVDGTDNNDVWVNQSAVNQSGIGGIAGSIMPVDAIDEFSLQSSSGAQTGRNPGATVNLTIKSGTNQLHGSAYYFNRNEAYAASPAFTPKIETRNQQFGFSVGGPVIKNNTFFFLAFERQLFSIGLGSLATEPSQAYQAQANALLAQYHLTESPVSANMLATLWPAGALTGPAAANNYFSPNPESGNSYNEVLKIDHNFNSKNALSVRGFVASGFQIAPVGSELQYYYEAAPLHTQNYSVIYTASISPRFTNQLLLGVNYYSQSFRDANHSFNLNQLGFNLNAQFTGAPHLTITGFDPIGETPPEGRADYTGQVTDDASYTIGRHQLVFGGEYTRVYLDEFYYLNSIGTFTYTDQGGPWYTTGLAPGVNATVAALASFEAGFVTSSSIARGNPERDVYINEYNGFASDTWQVSHRLNINYGLRYDYSGPMYNGAQNLSTFIPGSGSTGLAIAGSTISSLYPPDRTAFAPRVGFSFQPQNNTVIRGAFGIFYDTPSLRPLLENVQSNGGPDGIEANPIGPSPVQTITQTGYTVQPNVPIMPSTTNSQVGIFAVDQNFRTPYTYNFNLNVQQSLGSRAVFQIGYVGSESRKQEAVRDINQAALAPLGTPASQVNTGLQQRRPYYSQYPNYSYINQVGSIANSNYSSLQAVLSVRNYHGMVATVNYTWSHALDDVTSYTTQLPQNSFNFKNNYGNSDYDTRNNFNAVVSYDLPKRGTSRLFNGWQFNSLLVFRSGLPYNIHTGTDTTGTNEGTQRVDLIGNPTAGISRARVGKNAVTWINPAAFAAPAPGTYGTLARNALYGPGFGSVDLSVFKNTPITERVSSQFRAEMFNVFNRANLAPPSTTLGTSSFGTVASTIGAADGAPGIGAGEPFNLQLALKILF